jgi:hypothetical protein
MTILGPCSGDKQCGCPNPHPDADHYTFIKRFQQAVVSTYSDHGQGGSHPPRYYESQTQIDAALPAGIYLLKYCGQGHWSRVAGPGWTAYQVADAHYYPAASVYTQTDGNTFLSWVHNEPVYNGSQSGFCSSPNGWLSATHGGYDEAIAALHSQACVSIVFSVSEAQEVTLKFDGGAYFWNPAIYAYEPRCEPSGATWPEPQADADRLWWGLYEVSPELEVVCVHVDPWYGDPGQPYVQTGWRVFARVRSVLPFTLTYDYAAPAGSGTFTCGNVTTAEFAVKEFTFAQLAEQNVEVQLAEHATGVSVPSLLVGLSRNPVAMLSPMPVNAWTNEANGYKSAFLAWQNTGTLPSKCNHAQVAPTVAASSNLTGTVTFTLTAYFQYLYGYINQCGSPPVTEQFRIYTKLKLLDPTKKGSVTLQWADSDGTEQVTWEIAPWA